MSKRVLNLFWGKFFQKKCYPSVPWRLGSSKLFKKKSKKFSKFQPKTHKTVPKRIQKCFEHVLGQIFRKIFAQFSMEGRVFENFQKKTKNFQNSNQKRTKPFSKESKSVLNIFWGNFFKKFLPSFPWSVESSKHFKKNQKIFKNHTKNAQNRSKRIQKCFEHFFGAIFLKIFCPAFHGKSSLRKISKKAKSFQSSKNAQNRSQKHPDVFGTCFGAKFSKIFLPSVPWMVESSKIFKKIKEISKFQKMPKIVPKSIQTCFEQVLGQIFRKIFAQFSMECRVFETFQKKSKNFQNSNQKRTKPFPKESKSVLNMFWGNFSEKVLPSFPWGVESSKIFKKNKEFSKFQKS